MKSNGLDNRINRINKKVQRIRDTLGKRSSLFGRAAAIINGALKDIRGLVDYKNDYRIKRGNAVKNLKPEQQLRLSEALDQIEIQLDQRSLSDEKKRLRELVYITRGKRGGRVTIAEYKAAERLAKERAHLFDQALAYYYDHIDETDEEHREMAKILTVRGRLKTQYELEMFIILANSHLMRTTSKDPKKRASRQNTYGLTPQKLFEASIGSAVSQQTFGKFRRRTK